MKEKLIKYFVEGEDEDFLEYKKLAQEISEYSSVLNQISIDSQRHATYFRRMLLGNLNFDFPESLKKIKVPTIPSGKGKWDDKIKEEISVIKSYLAFAEENKEYKPIIRSIVSDEIKHISFLEDIKNNRPINILRKNPIDWAVLLASVAGSIVATLLATVVISSDIRKLGHNSIFHREVEIVDKIKDKNKKAKKNPPIDWDLTGSIGNMVAQKGNKKIVIKKKKEEPAVIKFYKGNKKIIETTVDDENIEDVVISLITEEPDRVFSYIEESYNGHELKLNPNSMENFIYGIIIDVKVPVLNKLRGDKWYYTSWITVKLLDGTFVGCNLYLRDSEGHNRSEPKKDDFVKFDTRSIEWKLHKSGQYYINASGITFKRLFKIIEMNPTGLNGQSWAEMYIYIENRIGQPPGKTSGNFPTSDLIKKWSNLKSPSEFDAFRDYVLQGHSSQDNEIKSTIKKRLYFSDSSPPTDGQEVYIDRKKVLERGDICPGTGDKDVWGPGIVKYHPSSSTSVIVSFAEGESVAGKYFKHSDLFVYSEPEPEPEPEEKLVLGEEIKIGAKFKLWNPSIIKRKFDIPLNKINKIKYNPIDEEDYFQWKDEDSTWKGYNIRMDTSHTVAYGKIQDDFFSKAESHFLETPKWTPCRRRK